MIRFFDFVLSTIAIVLLSPLFVLVMIILKLTGEHEIFYLQERIGRNERPFKVFKFATMLKDSPNMAGGTVTRSRDPRVLPFGGFLRKTKINELPQLFNIWLGQMSLIGPRPLTPKQYFLYSEEKRAKISKMRPGLSGIGSIVFRDEEAIMARIDMDHNEVHNKILTPYKGELECWYYDNRSVFLYFKLMIFTLVVVVNPKVNLLSLFKELPLPTKELDGLI